MQITSSATQTLQFAPGSIIAHILQFCPPQSIVQHQYFIISKAWYQFFYDTAGNAADTHDGTPMASPHLKKLAQVYFHEFQGHSLPYANIIPLILSDMTTRMFFERLRHKTRPVVPTNTNLLDSLPELERQITETQDRRIQELDASMDVFAWYFQCMRFTRDALHKNLRAMELQIQEIGDLQDKLLNLEVDMEDMQEDLAQREERDEESTLCCICMERVRSVLLMPCKHFCICDECESLVEDCPLCRAKCESKILSIKM